MSNNKAFNYLDANGVPFRGPYPYGPYMPTPPYGAQWAPHSPQQLPRMWSDPNDHYRRYDYTAVNTHKDNCCLSNSNRRGCHKSDQFCAKCQQLLRESGDASEVDDNEKADNLMVRSDGDELNEMALALDGMQSTVNQLSDDLKENKIQSKIDLLDTKTQLLLEVIDNREKSLKLLTSKVKDESTRFVQNYPTLRHYMTLASDLRDEWVKTRDIKQFIETQLKDLKSKIDENPNLDLSAIDSKLVYDLPDLAQICFNGLHKVVEEKMIEETIKVVKRQLNRSKEAIDDSNTETQIITNEEIEVVETIEDPIVDLFQKESNVGKVFGNDLWPIIELHFVQTTTDAVPQESKDVVTETSIDKSCEPVEDVVNVKMIKPIAQPMAKPKAQPMHKEMAKELMFEAIVLTKGDNRVEKGSNKSSNSDSSHSLNTFNSVSNLNITNGSTVTDAQVKPSAQQQKIIDKLKTIHSYLSEEVLFEKILETKEMFVSFGNTKGFSGMKLTEVVEAVSKFIASELVSDSSDFETPPELVNKMDSNCRICRKLIERNKMCHRLTLSCGHSFHFNCLELWAQTNNKCAECHTFF